MFPKKTTKFPKKAFTNEQIRAKAYEIWEKNKEQSEEENWNAAIEALKREQLFKPVIKSLQWSGKGLKPFINFFWKTLPTSDWVKVLAVPIIIGFFGSWIANTFQDQSRQNDIVNKYFEKMEKFIIEKKIDVSKKGTPEKALIKGESLFTLRSIDIKRREALINFLSEYGLLNYSKNGISLGYFDLSKINLSGLNLTNIDLNHAILSESNLSGANLSGANLLVADLGSANLDGANLSGAKLFGAKLDGASLRDANLQYANLDKANLNKAKLFSAGLLGANLLGANLSDADLRFADLKGASLSDAKLNKAVLEYANLKGANLEYANLSDADLNKADLSDADLNKADLRFADLNKATLYFANLEGANLYKVLITNNQIKAACYWKNAIYTEAEWDDNQELWIVKDKTANRKKIDEIEQDKASDLQTRPDCSRWKPTAQ